MVKKYNSRYGTPDIYILLLPLLGHDAIVPRNCRPPFEQGKVRGGSSACLSANPFSTGDETFCLILIQWRTSMKKWFVLSLVVMQLSVATSWGTSKTVVLATTPAPRIPDCWIC